MKTKVDELVHVDLCGPMEKRSIGGAPYFLLIKDDFSHYKKVFFLKEKNEVCGFLEKYLYDVRTEAGNHEI